MNQLQKKTDLKGQLTNIFTESRRADIESLASKYLTPDRLLTLVLQAVSRQPLLASCTAASIYESARTAATLGLEPDGVLGRAYLVPYRQKNGTYVANFMLGYQGMIELALRSGKVRKIYSICVHEQDDFDIEYGLDPKIKHKPARGDRGKMEAVYAAAQLDTGATMFEYMSHSEVLEHKQRYSKARHSPWDTAFDEMAKKTVVRRLCKYLPMSRELSDGLRSEANVIDVEPEPMKAMPAIPKALPEAVEPEAEAIEPEAEKDLPENDFFKDDEK